ncbi:MAG TPA: hypothetical protein VH560_12760 [Polyangia bacterium]|nr:hypothetical protein [Polyangia bacterium]
MQSARRLILGTLILAFGLGLYAFHAITTTAARRSTFVDQAAASMPTIPGARLISPWEPATYADDVRAMYCLEAADPDTGGARALRAFTAAGWKTTETYHDPKFDTFAFLVSGPIRVRAGLARGTRPDCSGAKHQVTLALDGTR